MQLEIEEELNDSISEAKSNEEPRQVFRVVSPTFRTHHRTDELI